MGFLNWVCYKRKVILVCTLWSCSGTLEVGSFLFLVVDFTLPLSEVKPFLARCENILLGDIPLTKKKLKTKEKHKICFWYFNIAGKKNKAKEKLRRMQGNMVNTIHGSISL